MYDVLKSVISVGDYKLAEIQRKAKKLFVLGDLNEDQLDDLLVMASSSVSAEAERPETLELIHALAEKVHVLETLVKKSAGENSDEQTGYPAWKPWDGISKDYPQGAVVSHNGELWESVFNGQNVWEPGAPGTESLWAQYEEVYQEPIEDVV